MVQESGVVLQDARAGVLQLTATTTASGEMGYLAWCEAEILSSSGRTAQALVRVPRARVESAPSDALRTALTCLLGRRLRPSEVQHGTNHESYGYETMVRLLCWGEWFIGMPRATASAAENEACRLVLAVYKDKGYIVWT